MKKKIYEKPSVEVVILQQQTHLLAGSGDAKLKNYEWNTYEEE